MAVGQATTPGCSHRITKVVSIGMFTNTFFGWLVLTHVDLPLPRPRFPHTQARPAATTVGHLPRISWSTGTFRAMSSLSRTVATLEAHLAGFPQFPVTSGDFPRSSSSRWASHQRVPWFRVQPSRLTPAMAVSAIQHNWASQLVKGGLQHLCALWTLLSMHPTSGHRCLISSDYGFINDDNV